MPSPLRVRTFTSLPAVPHATASVVAFANYLKMLVEVPRRTYAVTYDGATVSWWDAYEAPEMDWDLVTTCPVIPGTLGPRDWDELCDDLQDAFDDGYTLDGPKFSALVETWIHPVHGPLTRAVYAGILFPEVRARRGGIGYDNA